MDEEKAKQLFKILNEAIIAVRQLVHSKPTEYGLTDAQAANKQTIAHVPDKFGVGALVWFNDGKNAQDEVLILDDPAVAVSVLVGIASKVTNTTMAKGDDHVRFHFIKKLEKIMGSPREEIDGLMGN